MCKVINFSNIFLPLLERMKKSDMLKDFTIRNNRKRREKTIKNFSIISEPKSNKEIHTTFAANM
jgi:hypothetical protein